MGMINKKMLIRNVYNYSSFFFVCPKNSEAKRKEMVVNR